ncbi:MAG: DUF5685 family protein [Clostridiales bacterium]|nr:DUF5685 family protein [Clostridiales bacterium]
MFGYIRPLTGELKVRELELYRSVYCGLCRAMKKQTGNLSRVSISYDFVFCAMCRAAVTGQSFKPEPRWCFLHPFDRRLIACENEALDSCALMSAVLTREKAYDNYSDSRFLSKLGSAMLLPEADHMLKKAEKADGQVEEVKKSVRRHLDDLYSLERAHCKSPDETAQATGEMLSDIFAYGLDGRRRSIASAIGLRVGRWVYLVDAADDYHKDLKSGGYNPFVEAGRKPDASLFEALRLELGAAKRALDLADGVDESVKAITENILCMGMTAPIEDMLAAKLMKYEEKTPEASPDAQSEKKDQDNKSAAVGSESEKPPEGSKKAESKAEGSAEGNNNAALDEKNSDPAVPSPEEKPAGGSASVGNDNNTDPDAAARSSGHKKRKHK